MHPLPHSVEDVWEPDAFLSGMGKKCRIFFRETIPCGKTFLMGMPKPDTLSQSDEHEALAMPVPF